MLDFSLPLAPSRWEGVPLNGIFRLRGKNITHCIIYYFIFAPESEISTERFPREAGGG